MKASASLRAVAVFEAAKGALVLLAGFKLLRVAHIHAQHVAETLVRHFHLNPASAHPRIFERLLHHFTDTQLRLLALGALAYAALRFVEAWGLWRERRWAEWLALASGAAVPTHRALRIQPHAPLGRGGGVRGQSAHRGNARISTAGPLRSRSAE